MTNLLEIADLAWSQLYPNPSDETMLQKEEFIATAKSEYAYQVLLGIWKEKREEGYYAVPGFLSRQVEKEVVNGVMDISDLKILRSIPQEVWLQNIGGLTCKCRYVKTTVNLSQALRDDDSMDDATRPYLVLGNQIIFPKGAHTSPLPLIYANAGEDIDGYMDIEDATGAVVRTRLIEIYGGKTGREDETKNENSNT